MRKAVCGLLILFIAVICGGCSGSIELGESTWIPMSAKNASGDEVQLKEVYNTRYDNYQGTLTFHSDGTFSFWMSPGNEMDGTHSGTYKPEGDKINVLFDDDTQSQFEVKKSGDSEFIIVTYNDYDITFSRQ